MSLINSKIRFAVEQDTGKVFCYLTSRHLNPIGVHSAPDGLWDLAKVKAAILAGENIHTALVKLPAPKPVDKVVQADADFSKAVDEKIKQGVDDLNAGAPAADPVVAEAPAVDPAAGSAAPAA